MISFEISFEGKKTGHVFFKSIYNLRARLYRITCSEASYFFNNNLFPAKMKNEIKNQIDAPMIMPEFLYMQELVCQPNGGKWPNF